MDKEGLGGTSLYIKLHGKKESWKEARNFITYVPIKDKCSNTKKSFYKELAEQILHTELEPTTFLDSVSEMMRTKKCSEAFLSAT